jgi:hypothetical protein
LRIIAQTLLLDTRRPKGARLLAERLRPAEIPTQFRSILLAAKTRAVIDFADGMRMNVACFFAAAKDGLKNRAQAGVAARPTPAGWMSR